MEIIETVQDCRDIVNTILNTCTVIGLDLEGVNLGPSGIICLMQIAMPNETVYVFDIFKNSGLMTAGHLSDILTDTRILKVMQDCRNDNANLLISFGIRLANVFDVQVAYNFIINRSMPLSRGTFQTVNLREICQRFNITFTEREKIDYRRNPTIWQKRPLTPVLLDHAYSDALILVKIYKKLISDITEYEKESIVSDSCRRLTFSALY